MIGIPPPSVYVSGPETIARALWPRMTPRGAFISRASGSVRLMRRHSGCFSSSASRPVQAPGTADRCPSAHKALRAEAPAAVAEPLSLAVANNDMPSLGLGDCDAPTDVSDRTRGDPLPVGTYQYKASPRHVPLVFDIPPGASMALDYLVTTEPQEGTGDSTEGLLLLDEATESWLCLDLLRAIECNRWVLQPGQGPARSGETNLDVIFDRIVESLWLAERSGG